MVKVSKLPAGRPSSKLNLFVVVVVDGKEKISEQISFIKLCLKTREPYVQLISAKKFLENVSF